MEGKDFPFLCLDYCAAKHANSIESLRHGAARSLSFSFLVNSPTSKFFPSPVPFVISQPRARILERGANIKALVLTVFLGLMQGCGCTPSPGGCMQYEAFSRKAPLYLFFLPSLTHLLHV